MLNLKLTFSITSLIFMIVFAVVGFLLAGSLLDFATGDALIFAVGAVIVHWSGEYLHNIGHALAARRAGYPMQGIRFWGALATSVYPADEGPVPPAAHIQRAMGGPLFSAGVTVVFLVATLLLAEGGGVFAAIALFGLVDNLAVFTVGACMPVGSFLPIPFESDGDTILRWRRHRTA
jgi:hypothetical protein